MILQRLKKAITKTLLYWQPGISAILTYRDVLFEKDGSRRSRNNAEQLYGVRVVQVAEIFEAIQALKDQPVKLSVPPRVFISYRWGTEEENAWVEDLARQLRERGYEVLYDKFLDQSGNEADVAEIVSRIASCHIFLMIVDPGYIERVGNSETEQFLSRGWAYVEFRIAQFIPIQLFRWGLLRSGDEVPRGSALPSERNLGNVADVRNSEKLKGALDSLFPTVRGIPEKTISQGAVQLLTQAVRRVLDGDLTEASSLARRVINRIPELKDGYRMFALCTLLENRIDEAYWAVEKMLRTDQIGGLGSPVIRRTNFLLAAQVHNSMGNHRSALDLMTYDMLDELYHLILANALANMGQERAAYAHILNAFEHQPMLRSGWKGLKNSIRRIYDAESEYDKRLLAKLINELYPLPGPLEITQFDMLAIKRGRLIIPKVSFIQECDIPEYHLGAFFNIAITIKSMNGIPFEVFNFTDSFSKEIGGHKYRICCSSCEHTISFSEKNEVLCHSCGAELIPSSGMPLGNLSACPYCNGNIFTLLAPALDGAYCPCPYCRVGEFKVRQ
jgi:ribosomal protein S27E